MFRWIRALLDKNKWHYVKTFELSILYNSKPCTLYYHLYETKAGDRKITFAVNVCLPKGIGLNRYAISRDLYQSKLVRWLNGRYDPDIPGCDQLEEDDLANKLRGKI